MHTHCQIGERILSARVPALGFVHSNLRTFDFAAAAEEDPMLSMAREIAVPTMNDGMEAVIRAASRERTFLSPHELRPSPMFTMP